MPTSHFHLPDDFPDLSLPDRNEPARAPARSFAAYSGISWKKGDRVLAPWEPHFLYAGTIVDLNQEQALIEFDDGESGWVLLSQVRTLHLRSGQKVFCRREMGDQYFPAAVGEIQGDRVKVLFADGHADEWTRIAALRVLCEAIGPQAAPTMTASHVAISRNIEGGARVWAPWNATTLFAGTVHVIQEDEFLIHFDDGDHGWVNGSQVLPLELPVGLPVLSRWKMGSQYYWARVEEVQAEKIFVIYDDGAEEWTTAAALALPCDPAGPNARPTTSSLLWSSAGRWLIPIGIGILYIVIRGALR